MALKQLRRCISLNGGTYQHLRDFAGAQSRSMSDVVEDLLAGIFETAKPPSMREISKAAAERRAKRTPPKRERTPAEKQESRLRFNPPPPATKKARKEKRGPAPVFGENDPDRARPRPTRATAKLRDLDGFDRALAMVGR